MKNLIEKIENSISSIFSKEDILKLLKEENPYSSFVVVYDEKDIPSNIVYKKLDGYLYELSSNDLSELKSAIFSIHESFYGKDVDDFIGLIEDSPKKFIELCSNLDTDMIELELHGNEIIPSLNLESISFNESQLLNFFK